MCCLHQKQVLYTRQTLLILSTACTITLTGQRILQTVDFNISYYRYCAWDSVSHLWSLITCNSLYRHTLNEDIFQKEIKCPACVSMAYSNVWMTIISQVSTVRYMRKSWACLQMQIFGSIERQRQQNLCPRLMIRCWVVPFFNQATVDDDISSHGNSTSSTFTDGDTVCCVSFECIFMSL